MFSGVVKMVDSGVELLPEDLFLALLDITRITQETGDSGTSAVVTIIAGSMVQQSFKVARIKE